MSISHKEKALGLALGFGCVCLLSCSENSVESTFTEKPNLSGVWVDTTGSILGLGSFDTTYLVSTLTLESGSFVLTVPELIQGYSIPGYTNYVTREKERDGTYEVVGDSLFIYYNSYIISRPDPEGPYDTTKTIYTEPFRFQFFDDSLALYFNNYVGIDTTYNPRDTSGAGGELHIIRGPSLLWSSTFWNMKYAGVFRRVKDQIIGQ
jgi:hypothetical protein